MPMFGVVNSYACPPVIPQAYAYSSVKIPFKTSNFRHLRLFIQKLDNFAFAPGF